MLGSGKQALVRRNTDTNRVALCFHYSIWRRLNLKVYLVNLELLLRNLFFEILF